MSKIDHGAVVDAARGNWVDTIAPRRARPFLRLARADRPIGTWLLLWPCWWSAALAAMAAGARFPDPFHLVLFAIGAFVMRGAGCVYNDIIDRDVDAAVERTRSRPIPSGQVRVRDAKLFMLALALTGFLVLIQFNAFTIVLGIGSLLIVAVYPYMKRVTHWPQAVLGLAFSWGALMGWAASFGTLGAPALALYAAAVLWTVGYDTIYAHQDKDDDAIIGLKSTALAFGKWTKPWLAAFYGGTILALGTAFAMAGAGAVFFLGLSVGAAQLAWQIITLEPSEADNCLKRFRSNRDFGAIIFIAAVADLLAGGV